MTKSYIQRIKELGYIINPGEDGGIIVLPQSRACGGIFYKHRKPSLHIFLHSKTPIECLTELIELAENLKLQNIPYKITNKKTAVDEFRKDLEKRKGLLKRMENL